MCVSACVCVCMCYLSFKRGGIVGGGGTLCLVPCALYLVPSFLRSKVPRCLNPLLSLSLGLCVCLSVRDVWFVKDGFEKL